MQKSIVIAREELKDAITGLINGSGLPMFVIADILRPILLEADEKSQLQYQMELKKYEESNQKEKEDD